MLLSLAAATISTATAAVPFEFQVRPGSTTWIVQAVGRPLEDDSDDLEVSSLRIIEKTTRARIIQEIFLDAEIVPWPKEWIEADDFDFDGWLDLAVNLGGGSGGLNYLVIRFDPERGRFREPLSLPNANPDPEKRVVHIGWRNGRCCGWDEEVRFVPGALEPVVLRSVDRTPADDAGYVESVEKFAMGLPRAHVVTTVKERDHKGRLRVLCRMQTDVDGVRKLLAGDAAKCPPPDTD